METNIQVLSEITTLVANIDKKVDELDKRTVKLFSYIYSEYTTHFETLNNEVARLKEQMNINTSNSQAIQNSLNKIVNVQDTISDTISSLSERVTTQEAKQAVISEKQIDIESNLSSVNNNVNKLMEEVTYTTNYVSKLTPSNTEQVVLITPPTGIYKFADMITRLFRRTDIQKAEEHKQRIKEINEELEKLKQEREQLEIERNKFKVEQEKIKNEVIEERKKLSNVKADKKKQEEARKNIAMILDNIR